MALLRHIPHRLLKVLNCSSIVSGFENPGGYLSTICWLCVASLSQPLPHYSQFCGQLYTLYLSLLGKCNFRDHKLVTFCLCIYLIKPFIKVIPKWIGAFVSNVVKILTVWNPELPEYSCLQNFENVRSHSSSQSSQSSRPKNATPSNGTSPLSYY